MKFCFEPSERSSNYPISSAFFCTEGENYEEKGEGCSVCVIGFTRQWCNGASLHGASRSLWNVSTVLEVHELNGTKLQREEKISREMKDIK